MLVAGLAASGKLLIPLERTDVRVVEGARLEIESTRAPERTGKRINALRINDLSPQEYPSMSDTVLTQNQFSFGDTVVIVLGNDESKKMLERDDLGSLLDEFFCRSPVDKLFRPEYSHISRAAYAPACAAGGSRFSRGDRRMEHCGGSLPRQLQD